jgi:uncharacterized Zn finger protein
MSWYGFRPYVPVARRRANAARQMAKLAKKGRAIDPVQIDGRKIAHTFWGKAWCENLESYSDFENRLPRGRTYVRNGSVVDLQIRPGKVTARISGSELYDIDIKIKPLSKPHWQAISSRCAGKIASVLELLQGRLSQGVMEIITHRESGLFPKPSEISLKCSCPDWADMCKHVAAALYGVGARLDQKPELLFVLRQVDHLKLIEQAAAGQVLAPAASSDKKTIAEGDLADVFGIEIDSTEASAAPPSPTTVTAAKASAEQTAAVRRQPAQRRAKKSKKPLASARRGRHAGKRGVPGRKQSKLAPTRKRRK